MQLITGMWVLKLTHGVKHHNCVKHFAATRDRRSTLAAFNLRDILW